MLIKLDFYQKGYGKVYLHENFEQQSCSKIIHQCDGYPFSEKFWGHSDLTLSTSMNMLYSTLVNTQFNVVEPFAYATKVVLQSLCLKDKNKYLWTV